MNKFLLILAFLAITIFISCKTAQQKEAIAKQNVINANQELRDTKISNTNEWLAFKAESQAKIIENEQRILKLKVEMNKPGSTFDGLYRTRIEKIEAKNNELKFKLNNYEGKDTGWKTFKSDFNRDMNEIGNNIKSLFE